MADDLPLPLKPVSDAPRPRLAPAWVALMSAWLGLLTLVCSIIVPFLPGSRHQREEAEHAQPFSMADKFIPFPLYLSVVAMFVGIVVLRQMKHEKRPLPDALVVQRVQAWAGIILSILGAAFLYIWVGFRGPR